MTGAFPVTSSRGNKYVLVVYAHGPNAIIPHPIKDRRAATLLTAYRSIVTYLTERGVHPTHVRCDNECPQSVKDFFADTGVTLQLVPPYDHRTNPAEHCIDVFKTHFLAGLALLPPECPKHLWCRLTPHAFLTLNLLRTSNQNPRLSAWADLEGSYVFDAHPLAPPGLPGCRI